MAYKKILVPLDGSEISEGAIEHAEHICKCDKIDYIIILRVFEPILVDARDMLEAERAAELQSKKEKEAKGYLKKVEKRLKDKGFEHLYQYWLLYLNKEKAMYKIVTSC